MGLGLNVHIECLKSPQRVPAEKFLPLLLLAPPSQMTGPECQELNCPDAIFVSWIGLHDP